MKKANLVLVGPLPPPYHGQSVSFNMLVSSLQDHYSTAVVNLAGKETEGKRGFYQSVKRTLEYVSILAKYIGSLRLKGCRVYLTIAQSKYGFYRDFIMLWSAFLLRRKTVVHLKGGNYGAFYSTQSPLTQFLVRATLLRVERILVLGKNLVDMYDFEPQLRKKVFVVENGLPFTIATATKSQANVSSTVKLLFLSNLIESKGYFDLLKAAKILKDRGLSFELHFAGDFYTNADDTVVESIEHAKSLFKKTIADYNLDDEVFYHGVVSGEDKNALFAASHIFVLPTHYNNEGQPVSIIEAIAFGLPVIATDYRAISDMVVDNVTGRFIKYGNADDIAGAVQEIWCNGMYNKMSEECVALYNSTFTTQAHLSRITPHILGEYPLES